MVVTGANGFLGSYLVAYLLKEGNHVVGIKRASGETYYFESILRNELGSLYDSLILNFKWKEADILDICSLDEILAGEDFVFHCAARVAFNKRDKEGMLLTNRNGTANIVNACMGSHIKKLVYVSSTAALGRSLTNNMISEELEWSDGDQNTGYAISKHLAELEVWRGMEEGLNAVIINPGIILGAGNWQTGSARFFRNIFNGFKFYTNGTNGFVGVKDVARIMSQLAERDISGERYLVVAENRSYHSVFNAIADALRMKRPNIEVKKEYRQFLAFIAGLLQFINPGATVTPETVNTSLKKIEYDNRKLKLLLGFEYTPIDDVINEAGATFLKSIQQEMAI